MTNKIAINKEITVTALYFRNNKDFLTFPKRIEYDGETYTFIESGFQYLVTQGKKIIRIFDMTDGKYNYRLSFDPERINWTLVNITTNV